MARPTPSVAESKRAADLLLKDLQSADCAVARSAAERFRRLTSYKSRSIEEILDSRAGHLVYPVRSLGYARHDIADVQSARLPPKRTE